MTSVFNAANYPSQDFHSFNADDIHLLVKKGIIYLLSNAECHWLADEQIITLSHNNDFLVA